MNEFNNFYGDAQESTGNSGTGEVSGYCMTNYELNDKGSLEIHFTKTFDSGKSITLKTWINAVNPEQVRVWEGKTKEECVKGEVTKLNRLVKSIVTNFVDKGEYEAAMKQVNSFESLVEVTKSLLPDNYSETQGTLVVGYNAKGYLSVPNRMGWDDTTKRHRPFFTVDSEVQLMDLPSNLTLEKPVPQAELAEIDIEDEF